MERLKHLENPHRLEELQRRIGFVQEREYGADRRQALTAADVRELRDSFDLESHGRFHPLLPTCSAAEAHEEIVGSRAEVEALTARPCRHFAFPGGRYTDREVELAMEAGYETARTIDIGWNGPRTDPHRLKTLTIADGLSGTMLIAELAGLKWLLRLVLGQGGWSGKLKPLGDGRTANPPTG